MIARRSRRSGRTPRWHHARWYLAMAALGCLLAACAQPAARTSSRPIASATGTATVSPHLSTRGPFAASTRLGPTPLTRVLTLTLQLQSRAPGGLQAANAAISDPHSPQYHHYLTPAQIAQQFGADPAAEARVEATLRDAGLTVTERSDDGLRLDAQGMAGRIAALFGIHFDDYRASDGEQFYAADAAPHLPSALSGTVVGVLGLDNRSVMHTGARTAPLQGAGVSGLAPADLQSAYDLAPLYQSGLNGANQTIALAEIDTFRQSDVQSYDQTYGIHAPTPQVIRVHGGATSTSPEPVLDIEVIHAIAPQANVLVYESAQDLGSVANMLNTIVSQNRAQVLSVSLGSCERQLDPSTAQSLVSSLNDTFQRADAEGMSVLVASGDNGAYDCQTNQLSVGVIAANPYITSVGGTALFTDANDAYGHEDGWEGPLEGAGGGGGVSILYQRPSWQGGPGVDNQFSDGMRQVPDVSADADPLTGYSIYYSGSSGCRGASCWHVVGGTSAATPLWAAIILLANQASQGHPLGFLNPALYRMGSGSSGAYHDVTSGGNLYYNATRAWDYSTGWGSPDAAALVHTILTVG